ncbi:MAG: polyamine aminopropyltransferase [Planctomycetota bacterium]
MGDSSAPSGTNESDHELPRFASLVLVGAVFAIAVCGLVYELVAGAMASYLIGDSVRQFSLIIGVFLAAMGGGSFLSKFIRERLLLRLIYLEIAVGVVGGFSGLGMFAAFAHTDIYQLVLLALVVAIGVLVGLEIPLVVRIVKDTQSLRTSLANLLAADYLGALGAAVLFPFLLLPNFGLVAAAMVAGIVNVLVAVLLLICFSSRLGASARGAWVWAIGATLSLAVGLAMSGAFVRFFESRAYQDEVILARTSEYQRVIVTRWRDDIRLFLNGQLQFSTVDEYRYHEPLVLPAMGLAPRPERVLILGGGDGLAAERVLAQTGVGRVDLVDLDAAVTDLFTDHEMLSTLNNGALRDDRLRVVSADAFQFLEDTEALYDVVIIDLPDPSDAATARLYSETFYRLVLRRLAPDGVAVTQATSPFRSREAFWCVVSTIESAVADRAGVESTDVRPYHTYVPSFGTWGFVLFGRLGDASPALPTTTRHLTQEVWRSMLVFPPDLNRIGSSVSTLDDPLVSRLYRTGYNRYFD